MFEVGKGVPVAFDLKSYPWISYNEWLAGTLTLMEKSEITWTFRYVNNAKISYSLLADVVDYSSNTLNLYSTTDFHSTNIFGLEVNYL